MIIIFKLIRIQIEAVSMVLFNAHSQGTTLSNGGYEICVLFPWFSSSKRDLSTRFMSSLLKYS